MVEASRQFDLCCNEYSIEHRLTKLGPLDERTDRQIEHMNSTIKETTVKKYYYQSRGELKKYLHTFPIVYKLRQTDQNPQNPFMIF